MAKSYLAGIVSFSIFVTPAQWSTSKRVVDGLGVAWEHGEPDGIRVFFKSAFKALLFRAKAGLDSEVIDSG